MEKDYEDIPGTFVFDADRSREGYHLNQFCISLRLQKDCRKTATHFRRMKKPILTASL